MTYVVGLGNPGEEYARTRHNAGWIVLEEIARKNAFGSWHAERSLKADVAEGTLSGAEVSFVRPATYMNNSGRSVAKLDPAGLIVVHDDIDLPRGSLRISYGRGAGGHNGVSSVIAALGTPDFVRVRIGVCPVSADGEARKPKDHEAVTKYLLSAAPKRELEEYVALADTVERILAAILEKGYLKAMDEFN